MTLSNSFYAQKDLLPEGEMAAKIRALVIRHLHSIPHHPYRDMEQQLVIKQLVHTPVYLQQMTGQFDRRSVRHVLEPYTGQVSPGALPSFQYLQNLSLQRPTKRTNQQYAYTYGGDVVTCYGCGGMGRNACYTCKGQGKSTCTSCGGQGSSICYSCSGTGKTYCSACDMNGNVKETCSSCGGQGYTESYSVSCSNCNGSGRSYGTSCYSCGGSGRRRQINKCYVCWARGSVYKSCSECNGYKSVTCSSCSGGRVYCNRCGGSGISTCSACNGYGYTTCTNCSGKGRLINYAVVTQELYYETDDTMLMVDLTLINQFAIKPVVQDAAANPVYQLTQQPLPAAISLGDAGLEKAYQQLLAGQRAKATGHTALLFQQFSMYRVSCYKVTCQYKQHAFTTLVYGRNNKVYDVDSPVIQYKQQLLKKAKDCYQYNFFVKCYRLSTQAVEMGAYVDGHKDVELLRRIRRHVVRPCKWGAWTGLLLMMACFPLVIPALKEAFAGHALPYYSEYCITGVFVVLLITTISWLFCSRFWTRWPWLCNVRQDVARLLLGIALYMAFLFIMVLVIATLFVYQYSHWIYKTGELTNRVIDWLYGTSSL